MNRLTYTTSLIQGMKTQILLVLDGKNPLEAHEVNMPYRMEKDVRSIIQKSDDYKEVKSIRTAYRVQRRHELLRDQGNALLELGGEVLVGRRMQVSNEFQGYKLSDYLAAWDFVTENQENPKVLELPNFKTMNEIVTFIHDVKFR